MQIIILSFTPTIFFGCLFLAINEMHVHLMNLKIYVYNFPKKTSDIFSTSVKPAHSSFDKKLNVSHNKQANEQARASSQNLESRFSLPQN